MTLTRGILIAAALSVVATAQAAPTASAAVPGPAAPPGPPATPVRPVTDTYWGTPVVDNYRYLENLADPEVQAWMHAQADYTRAQLDRLPGRTRLYERIHALANTDLYRGGFIRRGQRYFYQLLAVGAQQPKLYYRDGLAGEEHLLIDPGAMGAGSGTHYALDYYAPSWDGKRLVYGLSAGGSEASTTRVMDVDSGRVLEESITRTDLNVIGWLHDNASFFYLRYEAPTPTTPPSERKYNARTYLHRIGVHPTGDGDQVVFGRGVSAAVDVPEGQATYVHTSADSAYAVAVANHNHDTNPSTFYVAPLAAVKGAATRWRRFATVEDGIIEVELHGDMLYYLTSGGAARFRIMATPLAKPDVRHARVIVPESDGIVTGFGNARDGLYYRLRKGATAQLYRVGLDGQRAEAIALPFEGNVFGPVVDPTQGGALYSLQSWTRPPQLYVYDPAAHESRNTGLLPPSKIDTSELASEEVLVTSYDGTRVPLSILHRKDLKLDGLAPTVIDGYGAYGLVREAGFSPNLVAWLERGGVYALAHVRGGGELGEAWHRAGYKRSKPNTWLDFIACSQYLVDQGYTRPARLAGTGTSAGGILIGNAMATRPDLYRVILDRVGLSDALRFETEPNGPPNVSEMGSVSDEEGFHGLYAMSAYQHLRDGVAYPAVMYTTGANDPRVAPWHMMKMAARTQAATASGLPVLLRIDYDAGHGIGSNRSQREQQQADEWSFALWQMGDPDFQPRE
jgi:prolyl oligopeptidase